MGFLSIRIYQYRNLADADVQVDGKNVYLVGENGQGKTNFIEAVYLLCYGASFRTKTDRQMVTHEQGEMSVIGKYLSAGEVNTIAVAVTDKEKRIALNGKQVRDRKDLIGNNPCILFSHDDMELAKGSPEKRRLFFNQTMTLADAVFLDSLRRYSRLLKMRNQSLKEKRTELLDVYDEQIATAGFEMQEKREKAVAEFNRTFSPLFGRISGLSDELVIRYLPSFRGVTNTAEAMDELKRKREADIFFGTTTAGPHRDRFVFSLGKRNFAEIASTGQARLAALSLKVAQGIFFREKTGINPILLLDDVLLELDRSKRKLFLSNLPQYEQAFYTFLPNEEILSESRDTALLYTVKSGIFEKA